MLLRKMKTAFSKLMFNVAKALTVFGLLTFFGGLAIVPAEAMVLVMLVGMVMLGCGFFIGCYSVDFGGYSSDE